MLYARTIMNWDDVLSLMCGGVRSGYFCVRTRTHAQQLCRGRVV